MTRAKLLTVFEVWVALVVFADLMLLPSPPRVQLLLGLQGSMSFVDSLVKFLVVINFPYQLLLGRSVWGLGYFLNYGFVAAMKYAALSALAYQLLLVAIILLVKFFRKRVLSSAEPDPD